MFEEVNEKIEQLKEMIKDFENENPCADEYSEEIQELQSSIENDIENIENDYNMDSAGASGLYYGYGWTTTEVGAEEELDIYTKYTEKGLVDVIKEKKCLKS